MNKTIKLLLFFMMVLVGSEIALYAGRRPGRVRFSRNDPRSYSPEGRRDIRQKYRQERVDENMAQAEQEENIRQMQQEIVDAQEQIGLEQAQVRNLETQLASTVPNVEESEVAEQKSFLANKLVQAREKINELKDIIVNNKGKIIAAVAALGALGGGYLAYQAMQNADSGEDEPAVEVPSASRPALPTVHVVPTATQQEAYKERLNRLKNNEVYKKQLNIQEEWEKIKANLDKMPLAQLEPNVENLLKETESKLPNSTPEQQAVVQWQLKKTKEYIEGRKLAEQNQKKA